ncbi:MAG: DUF4343 domain-containing protein [Hydrotalea sp. AMD]|nr:MAG: DUF4343 domain-containing protein [Hydrotalea sp. AMD]
MGAEYMDHNVKVFEDVSTIPEDPTNILVGSVESLTEWLTKNGYPVPEAVDLLQYNQFLGRPIAESTMEDFSEWIKTVNREWINRYPTFIKPKSSIKAFTGFVPTDTLTLQVYTHGYNGPIWMQGFVSIVSEYRCYVSNNKIIGMKHYSGDCLVYPDSQFIKNCFEHSKTILDYHSYTLDFGILENGQTILIEVNDGWAIGNYGLEPLQYYLFVRDRWLQMTGIRKKMDHMF